MPLAEDPDQTAPRATWVWPSGEETIRLTSRIGVIFDEFVEPKSAFEGSVRLYRKGVDTAQGRVDGWISTQENVVNFTPKSPLAPNTTYVFEIPAGGIADFNGNALDEPLLQRLQQIGPANP